MPLLLSLPGEEVSRNDTARARIGMLHTINKTSEFNAMLKCLVFFTMHLFVFLLASSLLMMKVSAVTASVIAYVSVYIIEFDAVK